MGPPQAAVAPVAFVGRLHATQANMVGIGLTFTDTLKHSLLQKHDIF